MLLAQLSNDLGALELVQSVITLRFPENEKEHDSEQQAARLAKVGCMVEAMV